MSLDSFEEQALVLALATRLSKLSHPEFQCRAPHEAAAETLEWLVSERAVLVHVDAGSRTLEVPASPVSISKLAIYEIELDRNKPESTGYYPVYRWRTSTGETRSSNLLYVRGDYRVRQALTYLVEITGLYTAIKRRTSQKRLVIGFKDGPLVQQVSQYLAPSYSIPYETAVYALRYAGLKVEEAHSLAMQAKDDRSGKVNTGLLILLVLEKLRQLPEECGYPAGVVEDTSRSRALITWLLADLIIEGIKETVPSPASDYHLDVAQKILEQFNHVFSSSTLGRYGPCLCDTTLANYAGEFRGSLYTALRVLLDAINSTLASRGLTAGLEGLRGRLRGDGMKQVMRDLARVMMLGQVFQELATRDPDLVMLSYYLGLLRTYATRPVERLGPYASALDALERRDVLPESKKLRAKEAVERVLVGLRMSYVVTDPPMTCSGIEDQLRSRGLSGVLGVCEVASLDTYHYAPPVRLEFYEEPVPGLLVGTLLLESLPARYKFPLGVLVADKASRVTREEAATARPLEKRLLPLRYYIRSWEKRVGNL